jgi:hypothetical protein
MLSPTATKADRSTVLTTSASPGAITAFARMHYALEAGDYVAAKRFRRELRSSYRYSVCPLGPASARPTARADEQKSEGRDPGRPGLR